MQSDALVGRVADPALGHKMRKAAIQIVVAIALSGVAAWAVKVTLFGDMDLYIKRGKQVVIADFIAAHDTHDDQDGLYTAEVDVVKGLTGQTKLGKLRVLTQKLLDKALGKPEKP